jgi:hypothetical protein
MSIFYENILKKITYTYFEEELNVSQSIKVEKLSSLKENYENLKLNNIPENIIYTQGNEKYCIIRIDNFVYSFSFMSSSKIHHSMKSTLSLTFGLIKEPEKIRVADVANLTKMGNYRDASTRANVGPEIAKRLWKNIISYFTFAFSGTQMSYRSDLEAHEHALLSNLIDFLNKNTITKQEILDRLDVIKTKTNNSVLHSDISADLGKSDYYQFEGDLKTQANKKKILRNISNLEKIITNYNGKNMSKNELSRILSKFEEKNLIRTGLYTHMTKEIFGIKNVKKSINNLSDDIEKYLSEIKEKIKKEAIIIINNEEKSLVSDKEINPLLVEIKKIAESNSQNKVAEIEQIVDDFYSNTIQDFDFLKNRYVMLKL